MDDGLRDLGANAADDAIGAHQARGGDGLVVGLEMLPRRAQPVLDAWTAGQRMRELIPAVQKLWEGDYTHAGEAWQFPKTTSAPKPRVRSTLRALSESFSRWARAVESQPHSEVAQTILEESGYTEMWQKDRSADAAGRLKTVDGALPWTARWRWWELVTTSRGMTPSSKRAPAE